MWECTSRALPAERYMRIYGAVHCDSSTATAALDIARWDLEGRRRGEPLWRLLGGHRRKVPAYAGGIDLCFTLDFGALAAHRV